jgi:hypothetical protein
VYEDARIYETFFARPENVTDVRNILHEKTYYLEALRVAATAFRCVATARSASTTYAARADSRD